MKFNSGKSPVEVILKDPDYNIKGSIIGSVCTNMAILECLLELEKDCIVNVKNSDRVREIVNVFKSVLEPQSFEKLKKMNKYDFFETKLAYQYNTYHIASQSETNLLRLNNPFALAVLAGLYFIKSKKRKRRIFSI